jgi:hypothetical protein
MSDISGSGEIPPGELRSLEQLGDTFIANERDMRVAVLNAIDAGHDLRAVAAATNLPLSLVEEWTGESRRPDRPADSDGAAVDQVGEQRRLRSGSLRQRVDAADAKSARASRDGMESPGSPS